MSKRQRPAKRFKRLSELVVRYVNKKHWNTLNLFLALASFPKIGLPIHFRENDFQLECFEYTLDTIPGKTLDMFFDFCYPADMPDRENEIETDKKYYLSSAKFLLVFYGAEMVGCALYLIRDENMHLPLEYGWIKKETSKKEYYNINNDIGDKKTAEIYRLRRSFAINRHLIIPVVEMIFKAVWAKTVQTGVEYFYCTCDPENKELIHLYNDSLKLEDTGKRVLYDNDDKGWIVFRKDSFKNEFYFAAESVKHFMLQLYARRNLVQIVFTRYPGKILNFLIWLRKILYSLFRVFIKTAQK